MPESSPEATRSLTLKSAFESVRDFCAGWQGIIIALTGAFSAISPFEKAVRSLDLPPYVAYIAAFLLPTAVVVALTVPRLWRKHRERMLIRASTSGDAQSRIEEHRSDYFFIGPYAPNRQSSFERADNIHQEVLSWIRSTRERIVVLTGLSGTGKTSLLQAYVLPQLEAGAPGVSAFKILSARSFDDPLQELREAINEPGNIWERPPIIPANELWPELIRRVLTSIREQNPSAKLLIVFDQFEEFVVLGGTRSTEKAQMKSFLSGLNETGPEGVLLLLSLRADYKVFLESLGVPPLQQNINWREVSAFLQSTAEAFLKGPGSRIDYGAAVIDEVLDEAVKLDGTQGLIRPIILNMIGVVLQRTARNTPLKLRSPKLLERDLRQTINHPDVRQNARKILPELISGADTKRPRSIGELHRATAIDPDVINACLLDIGTKGYVRPLRITADVAGRVWELSHDFVARLLGQILKERTTTAWSAVRITFLLITAILWLVALFGGTSLALWWSRDSARIALSDRYEVILHTTAGGFSAKQYGNVDPTLEDSFPFLARLQPITTLDFSGASQLKGTAGIGALTSLQKLDLSSSGVETLTDIDRLQNLQTLNLRLCYSLADIHALAGAVRLQSLTLDLCQRLESLDGIEKLKNLQVLSLIACTRLKHIDALKNLASLQSLDLSSCFAVPVAEMVNCLPDVQELKLAACTQIIDASPAKYMPSLISLNLDDCPNLSTLYGLEGAKALEQLKGDDCPKLVDISALESASELDSLELTGCRSLKDVHAISNLVSLSFLDLSGCSSIETLPPLTKLDSLQKIVLRNCVSLESFENISGLQSLESLDASSCNHLQSLRGLTRLHNLRQVVLEHCDALNDLEGSSDLPVLSTLRLSGSSHLVSLNGIETLPNLIHVNCYGCVNLVDINAITRCPKLRSIDLRQIRNLQLADIQRLRRQLPSVEITISEEFYKSGSE